LSPNQAQEPNAGGINIRKTPRPESGHDVDLIMVSTAQVLEARAHSYGTV
jgi:hypothetical protein